MAVFSHLQNWRFCLVLEIGGFVSLKISGVFFLLEKYPPKNDIDENLTFIVFLNDFLW